LAKFRASAKAAYRAKPPKRRPQIRRGGARSRYFPYTRVFEKGRKYVAKDIVPDEFWKRQTDLTFWKKEDAEELVRRLKPLVGQYVILYGGSPNFTGEFWIAKLKKVEIDHPTFYDKPKPYKAKDKYIVTVLLKSGKPGYKLPNMRETFDPRLGSWKIKQIVPAETT
jgi:hypothetical protein